MRLKERFDKDKIFFTSDTHFFHNNIIQYCDRPFKNVEDMNLAMISNWEKTIPNDGIVFHLGDVSLTAYPRNLEKLLQSLPGTKYLVIGNHEKDVLGQAYTRNCFKAVYDILEIFVPDEEIEYEEQHIVMAHYPFITWNASHRGSWNFFGHVHGTLNGKHGPSQIDVGVDSHNFMPLSYQKTKEIITKQHLHVKN